MEDFMSKFVDKKTCLKKLLYINEIFFENGGVIEFCSNYHRNGYEVSLRGDGDVIQVIVPIDTFKDNYSFDINNKKSLKKLVKKLIKQINKQEEMKQIRRSESKRIYDLMDEKQ